MTTGTTREYHPTAAMSRPSKRRKALIVSSLIVVITLIVGIIAADRIVDHLAEERIAEKFAPYGDAEVDVRGFPVLTQVAAGRLDSVQVTAASATYESLDVTDVSLQLFDVPRDSSRPIGTVDAEATIPLAALDALAADRASLPDGMTFETAEGKLFLAGSLFGQPLRVQIDPAAEGRSIVVSATTIKLGAAEADLSLLPGFLTSAISDIVIDLDSLPAGLDLTEVEPVDNGVRVRLHGSGVMVS